MSNSEMRNAGVIFWSPGILYRCLVALNMLLTRWGSFFQLSSKGPVSKYDDPGLSSPTSSHLPGPASSADMRSHRSPVARFAAAEDGMEAARGRRRAASGPRGAAEAGCSTVEHLASKKFTIRQDVLQWNTRESQGYRRRREQRTRKSVPRGRRITVPRATWTSTRKKSCVEGDEEIDEAINKVPVIMGRRANSDKAKERGNALFKTGKFREALKEYMEAIEKDETNSAAYSNAAQCMLKIGGMHEATYECANAAVDLLWPSEFEEPDPRQNKLAIKSLLRRALASEGFDAKENLERSLVDLTVVKAAGVDVSHDIQRVRTRLQELASMPSDYDQDVDLMADFMDIEDKRLQASGADLSDLPKIEVEPFVGVSRRRQKAEMADLLSTAMQTVDSGKVRESIGNARGALMMSVVLSDLPCTLMSLVVLSCAYAQLREFDTAEDYYRRAFQVLGTYCPIEALEPGGDVPRRLGKGRHITGLSHPMSLYSARTILVCQVHAHTAAGRVHSIAMRMGDAIHSYQRSEQLLRCFSGAQADGMLATTLANIGNNFSKNRCPDQASKYYDESEEIQLRLKKKGGGAAPDHAEIIGFITSKALLLNEQGQAGKAIEILEQLWETSDWKPNLSTQKIQIALLLTNISPVTNQPLWFERFREAVATTGKDVSKTCPVCLDPLCAAPTKGKKTRTTRELYITTCHHALHRACWEAHRSTTETKDPGKPICCPVCRHPIVVGTVPTVVGPTGKAVPLRQGREHTDFVNAVNEGC